jgi:type IV pilus assembly protein PilZ
MQVMLRDKAALLASYMPWIARGGLFVQTARPFALGDDIYLLVGLPQDATRHPLAGKVVWITPAQAGGGRPQGVGVAFPDDDKARLLRQRIEDLLGTALEGSASTHTL